MGWDGMGLDGMGWDISQTTRNTRAPGGANLFNLSVHEKCYYLKNTLIDTDKCLLILIDAHLCGCWLMLNDDDCCALCSQSSESVVETESLSWFSETL